MGIRTYAITIKPESAFGTPLKGDTIFGQFCWQAAEDPALLNGGLDEWIERYSERPFAVFSSAWPVFLDRGRWVFAVRRPELPLFRLGDPEGVSDCAERLRMRKKNKARRWLLLPEDLSVRVAWENLLDDHALFDRIMAGFSEEEQRAASAGGIRRFALQAEQQHNTINRLTMTTGKGMFAPYVMKNTWYVPGMELVIFVALDEEAISLEQVREGLARMGQWGFGRDASTGLGRFSLGEDEEVSWPERREGQAVFTLAPCVPEQGRFHEAFFAPFTRFGRHGAQLLHKGKPFKNPVVMADEGAVFVPRADHRIDRPWIGRAVDGLSKAMEQTVAQGYALVLPFTMPH